MTDRSLSRAATEPLVVPDAGCERTVHLLYQRRSQEMFGFARRLGLGDEEASDAVQETMLRLWRELDSGTDVADPDAWAFRVLYRLARGKPVSSVFEEEFIRLNLREEWVESSPMIDRPHLKG